MTRRAWVNHKVYKGYLIERIEPPRQKRSNYRVEHPVYGSMKEKKTVDDCIEFLDLYHVWGVNADLRDLSAQAQLMWNFMRTEKHASADDIAELAPSDKSEWATYLFMNCNKFWDGNQWVEKYPYFRGKSLPVALHDPKVVKQYIEALEALSAFKRG